MRRHLVFIAAVAASGVVLAVACTFPEIAFVGDSASSAGSGGGSSSSAGASGSGGAAASTSASSTSSSAGTGGALPCVKPCDCDDDGDNSAAADCDHDGGDCNDHDPLVNSKQMNFFTDAGSNGFDYNCNKQSDFEIPAVLTCKNVGDLCDTKTKRWQQGTTVPACGDAGTVGTCMGVVGLCSEALQGTKLQGCH